MKISEKICIEFSAIQISIYLIVFHSSSTVFELTAEKQHIQTSKLEISHEYSYHKKIFQDNERTLHYLQFFHFD